MARPVQFEHYRFIGDKRTLVVYDLDLYGVDPDVTEAVDDVLASERFIAISPQTLAEARNRGYTLATPGASRRHRKPRA